MIKLFAAAPLLFAAATALQPAGCDIGDERLKPQSSTGVKKAEAVVKTGGDGLTNEQRNVKMKLEIENAPGAIKHLYVISAMSGQVIIYSTVDGKITSSGKRLTPTSVTSTDGDMVSSDFHGVAVNIGGRDYRTTEVLQDDGTYGDSIPYLYWKDVKGIYHQHYVSGGQIIHVSQEPLPIKSVMINIENASASTGPAASDTVEPQEKK